MYRAVQGDTFDLIARKEYGDDTKSADLRRANPGVSEPIQAGAAIVVPVLPDAPRDALASGVDVGRDEVTLTLDGLRFRYWTAFELRRSIDKPSAVTFAAPFDPDDIEQRTTFRPFSFPFVSVDIGNELQFDGVLVAPTPTSDPKSTTVSASAYSRAGVLADCTPPASAFPVEFDGLNLLQIATALARPFGVGVQFDVDPGAVFRRVKLEPNKKILPFLTELAQERGILIGDTTAGDLLFTRADDIYFPVATLRQGEQPLLSVIPTFKPQEYYSDVTAFRTTKVGSRGSQYTAKNPRLAGVLRPLNFIAKDGRKADPEVAARAKLGRMFANAVSYVVTVATWRDPAGALWEPNTAIRVIYPKAMIYRETDFLIRDVALLGGPKSKTARLSVVLPEAFAGGVPEVMPWDD